MGPLSAVLTSYVEVGMAVLVLLMVSTVRLKGTFSTWMISSSLRMKPTGNTASDKSWSTARSRDCGLTDGGLTCTLHTMLNNSPA